MNELHRRIAHYVHTLDEQHDRYKHRAEFVSDKWCRIAKVDKVDNYADGSPINSVRGFVALIDYTTKTLGDVKAGNIHKADGWKRAAKTVSGSVFDLDIPADFQSTISTKKPKPRRKKMHAATIRNEIADALGIPKARLIIEWDRYFLRIFVIDTTEGELFRVVEWADTHKARVGFRVVHTFQDGKHEDGLLDTHEALDALDQLANER